jgi:multidrug efflux pump subunit AcrA (membrane-fusion protein)
MKSLTLRKHHEPLRLALTGFLLVGSLSFTACSKSNDPAAKGESAEHGKGDGHGHEEEAEGGVAFKEGRGLQLSPAIVKALDLKKVDATERPLKADTRVVAQVFMLKPAILASASIPETEAQHLEKHTFEGAKLVRVERATAQATRLVDVVFQLDRTPPPQLGEFVTVAVGADSTTALAVPTSALLETATGTYVYVVNSQYYLRTPVKIGVRAGEFVEITDGLYAGDEVVASPVNQLWLAELRLTKGGGHSH